MSVAGSQPAMRCSLLSRRDGESMAGTAPADGTWLFVEYAGPWGKRALAESRLPVAVREFLLGLESDDSSAPVRVQFIRRHGGASGPGVRVVAARLAADASRNRVFSGVLGDVADVCDLDLDALRSGGEVPGLDPLDGPLWLVCTNGSRDVCCAESGRPVAAALTALWPQETWETTHLGGHRFAGTMLGLPSGVMLGRLDATTAVVACGQLAAGRVPLAHARGRAGVPAVGQVAELHLRQELALPELAAVTLDQVSGGTCELRADQRYVVEVAQSPGEPRQQSCGDGAPKAAREFRVTDWHAVGEPDSGQP